MPTLKIPGGELYCEAHGFHPRKGPEHLHASIHRVSQFLVRHTPR
jgi:hypothetical protein